MHVITTDCIGQSRMRRARRHPSAAFAAGRGHALIRTAVTFCSWHPVSATVRRGPVRGPSLAVCRLLAWFLPLGEAVEKGIETEQESALIIGVLGEARRFDDERQVADVKLGQGGRRSGIATLAQF